jgi:hypothetical protein
MYASIRRYTVDPKDAPEIFKRLKGGNIESIIGSIPGCIAYYAVDGGGGAIATVSVFEDKAGAEESNARAAAWVKENVTTDFSISPVDITAGDVAVKI